MSVKLNFRALAQQLVIAKNNLKMSKVTLRQLSLKAVFYHREVLIQISPTSAQRLDNLRKEEC